MKIGLQTFTVRKIFQSEQDINYTLDKLRHMGIRYLELAYIPWNQDYIDLLETCLKKYDMKAISSQIKHTVIEKHFDELIRIHHQLGIRYMAVSIMPPRYLFAVKQFAKRLNTLGERLKKEKIQLLFHHHDHEFIRLPWGKAIDILTQELDPENVQYLSDTYWIAKKGYDVMEFLETYKSHIKALHLRGHHKKQDTNLSETDLTIGDIIQYGIDHEFYYGVIEQNSNDPLAQTEKSITRICQDGFTSCLGGK